MKMPRAMREYDLFGAVTPPEFEKMGYMEALPVCFASNGGYKATTT